MGLQAWVAQLVGIERPFELPLEGLDTLVELRSTLDRIEALLVVKARANGSSWEEIGSALGISRQAAHARHGPPSTRQTGTVPARPVDEGTGVG